MKKKIMEPDLNEKKEFYWEEFRDYFLGGGFMEGEYFDDEYRPWWRMWKMGVMHERTLRVKSGKV